MASPADDDKRAWRRRLRTLRDALDEPARLSGGDAVRERVLALPEVKSGITILAYASDKSEVPTYTLIEDLLASGIAVALPVIESAEVMSACRIDSLKDLEPGKFGILAPRAAMLGEDRRVASPEVALVPGLGFDGGSGHRLGRGAGHYDRFLADRPGCFTVGIAFDEQVVEGLVVEPHDVPMRAVVTPSRTLRFPVERG